MFVACNIHPISPLCMMHNMSEFWAMKVSLRHWQSGFCTTWSQDNKLSSCPHPTHATTTPTWDLRLVRLNLRFGRLKPRSSYFLAFQRFPRAFKPHIQFLDEHALSLACFGICLGWRGRWKKSGSMPKLKQGV